MAKSVRVSKWDNVKCILILLVVIGHFTNQFSAESEIMRIISFYIYTFHMPLFIFMAGLMERKWNHEHPFRWKKVLFFITIGYSLKLAIYLIKLFYGRSPDFKFFGDTGIPWYMFAMAAFYIIMYKMRNLDWRVFLPLSVIFACLVGYVDWVGSFLYLSRIIVFFPFYYLGYIMNPNQLLKISKNYLVKELSLAVILSGMVITTVFIDDIYSYIRLSTGRNAYAYISGGDCGFMHRMVFFLIAIALGWALINLVPEKPFKLMGRIGSHTLQIYFWHRLVLYIIMYSGFADKIHRSLPSWWMAAYLLLAVVITVILSERIFEKPLQWLQKMSDWIWNRFRLVLA